MRSVERFSKGGQRELGRAGQGRRARIGCAHQVAHGFPTDDPELGFQLLDRLARFRATPAQTRWYFESVREALCHGLPAQLLDELDRLLAELRGLVPGPA